MAKKSQPSGKAGSTVKKGSKIGDSGKSMEILRKAAEIPPKSGSGSSKKNK